MPQSFKVTKNERYPPFMINVKSGESPGSPVLRNLSVSNADRRSLYGVSAISSSQRHMMNRTQVFNKESFSPHLGRADDANSVRSNQKSVRNVISSAIQVAENERDRSYSRQSSKDSRFSRPVSKISRKSKGQNQNVSHFQTLNLLLVDKQEEKTSARGLI